jgi:hypothetical protein
MNWSIQQKLAALRGTCEPEIIETADRLEEAADTDGIFELYEEVFGEEPEPTDEEIFEAMCHDAKRLGREDEVELL